MGGFVGRRVDDLQRVRDAKKTAYDSLVASLGADSPEAKEQKKQWDLAQTALDAVLQYYKDTLSEVALNYPAPVITRQSEVLGRQLEQLQQLRLKAYVGLFQAHLAAFREKGDVPSPIILNDVREPR
jgi:hypothetical protein